MKKIILFSVAALLIVSCGKKATTQDGQTTEPISVQEQEEQAKIDLKAEYDRLYTEADEAFNEAESEELEMKIYHDFLEASYTLLAENLGAPYSDTLFSMISPGLSLEQRNALFEQMPQNMQESPLIAEQYQYFQAEKKTSAGAQYIDFAATTPEGTELALSELVGKTDYVLVDFWASWCGPCRRLIPVLKEIYAGQPKGRFQIFSCSLDNNEAAWRKALNDEQMPWPQVREKDDRFGSEQYAVQHIPTTILIDKNGIIIAREPDESELEEILMK